MLVSTWVSRQVMAHTFGDLEETTDRLHRHLAAGVSSASHRSQVNSQWHGLGTWKHHVDRTATEGKEKHFFKMVFF